MMKKTKILALFLTVSVAVTGCGQVSSAQAAPSNAAGEDCGIQNTETADTAVSENGMNGMSVSLDEIPSYAGNPYTVLNDNVPAFSEGDCTTEEFETYSELDALGRCGVAYANICTDIMPTEEREGIGQIRPSGWHTVKYETVDGLYLYNRCHLIAFCLAGENANEKNLITGTRYLNIEGMLPFENMVADYVKETDNHVLYRVTPMYQGEDLVAKGVLMEGYSVEDQGEGICFNVFAYNVQPGITIDYSTGESYYNGNTEAEEFPSEESVVVPDVSESMDEIESEVTGTYIINTNTKKFHKENCSSVSAMSEANKETYTGSREDLLHEGYTPCKNCKP